MTPEDEAFNEIERQAKQRKEAVLQALHDEDERLGLYKDAYGEKPVAITELMDELALARVLIRELGDRLAKLEKPWIGLTRDEQSFVYSSLHNATSREDSFWVDFANAIEQALKERNA